MADHTISPIPRNQRFLKNHDINTLQTLGIFTRLHIDNFEQLTIGVNISFFTFSVSLASKTNLLSYAIKTRIP